MKISALFHFPDVCRLCMQQKPAPEMVPLASILPEFDMQLLELMDEFCGSPSQQDFSDLLPSAVCEQCQQHFLAAFKFKRKMMFLRDFQMAFLLMNHNGDSQPLRQLFDDRYETMSSQFQEIDLIDRDHKLRWEDLTVSMERHEGSIKQKDGAAEDDLEMALRENEMNEDNDQIFTVELLENSGDDGFSCHSDFSDENVEIEYLDVEHGSNDGGMEVEQSANCDEEKLIFAEADNANCAIPALERSEHEAEVEWNCDFENCKERFSCEDELIQHKEKIHRCWVCSICGVVLKNKYSLNVHIRRHKGLTKYPCEYCSSSFYTSQEYKLHLGLVHVASEMAKCGICGLEFKNVTCLKRHLKSHSEVRNYQCPYCEKAFKTNMHLHRHKETIHLNVRFKCGHCDVSYGRKDKLRMHIERVHNIQMYFLCNICLKSFTTEDQRQEHMALHSQPKPLECGICLAAFLTREEFNKHVCISYREDYVCCARDFKFHTFYNKHMFLVHGVKANARVKPKDDKLIANVRAERKQEERCAKCEKTFPTRTQKNAHKPLCRGKQQNPEQPPVEDFVVEYIVPND
ncbi:zinc finger protein 845-like [Armigeres subalbatus]|uniref:zinc finger protein 845-like n=1 Tax=Armigeres subalbatus TaxID=124917 RepID=UPI002ED64C05